MRTIDDSLDDIYKRAYLVKIAEKSRNKRLMKITSLCASFCIVFIIAAVVMIRQFDNTVKLEGKNGDKLWISDIPRAEYVENPDYVGSGSSAYIKPYTREEFIESLKSEPILVVGKAQNVKSFFIDFQRFENGCYSWLVTTFDLNITREINGTFESDTIKCIGRVEVIRMDSGRKYGAYTTRTTVSFNVKTDLMYDPYGAFELDEVGELEWMINGEHYKVSDYADYFVRDKHYCEADGIGWYNENVTIKWEEIENK